MLMQMHHPMKPNAYKSALQAKYSGKINLACTCKLARIESDGIKHYTFNQAKVNLEDWIATCDNEKYCKNLFETFQKCQCS